MLDFSINNCKPWELVLAAVAALLRLQGLLQKPQLSVLTVTISSSVFSSFSSSQYPVVPKMVKKENLFIQ